MLRCVSSWRIVWNDAPMTYTLFDAPQEVSTSDDYYTPSWLFEDMGVTFDLDVAAPPGGVPWIPADKFFTMADDGLSQDWVGRVWMNPPYSQTTAWANRFQQHANGIALLPMSKAAWYNSLWATADGVATVPTSIKFDDRAIAFGLMLWAFGDWAVEAIARIGHVR